MKIVYDATLMKFMSLFESLTRARVKDCIAQDGMVIFVVQPNEIGKAIGPKGRNARKLEQILKKRVKIVEFSEEPATFIKSLVHPLQVREIKEEDGVFTITAADLKTRGMLIGRSASHLRKYESIVKRYFPIKELKVT